MSRLGVMFGEHVENCEICQDLEGDTKAQIEHFWDSIEAKE